MRPDSSSKVDRRRAGRVLLSGFLLGIPFLLPDPAKAQSILRRRGDLNSLRRSQRRAVYKPDVRILRPAGSGTTFRVGQRLTYSYSTRRGWVRKIEIRSGLQVLRVINLGQSSSGRGTFTITRSDLARAGKTGSQVGFSLRAWQGLPSYQSVSGISAPYRLRNDS